MYFWKAESLQTDLKAGAVTEKDMALYYVLTYSFIVFAMWSVDVNKDPLQIFDHIEYILMVVALALGTIFAFKKYTPADKFIERFICLSFPLMIRMLTYTILLAIPFEVMLEMNIMTKSFPYFLILTTIMNIWFYRRLGILMGKF
ncbi:MAG: hypothetical protein V4598_09665 [Bdellovibrionota bacterium]